ncbi:MAG: metallophosphoesterase family protein [Acidimicrobiales bacterium]
MTRLLAIADEEDDRLTHARLAAMRPDVVVACGDLRFDYLDFVASATNVPMIFVPGNHDPDVGRRRMSALGTGVGSGNGHADDDEPRLPSWCTSADGRIVRVGGLVAAGLGGSMRYNVGPNQYTESQMRRRANGLATRARVRGRRVDLLLTHAPPLGVGDGDDLCHRGFDCFHRLVDRLAPRYLIHGHIHPHGRPQPDRTMGGTTVINAIPHRVIEV